MNPSEIVTLLSWSSEEIRRLRRENEILNAQIYIVNVFANALGFKPQGGAMSEDIVWKMEKLKEQIINEMMTPAAPKGFKAAPAKSIEDVEEEI